MEPTQMSGPEMIEMEIQSALDDENLPHLSVNGFSTTLGTADVIVVIKHNNKSVALLNLSYTIAKTLSQKLGNSVSTLEKLTGNTIMTTDHIQAKVKEAEGEQD